MLMFNRNILFLPPQIFARISRADIENAALRQPHSSCLSNKGLNLFTVNNVFIDFSIVNLKSSASCADVIRIIVRCKLNAFPDDPMNRDQFALKLIRFHAYDSIFV